MEKQDRIFHVSAGDRARICEVTLLRGTTAEWQGRDEWDLPDWHVFVFDDGIIVGMTLRFGPLATAADGPDEDRQVLEVRPTAPTGTT